MGGCVPAPGTCETKRPAGYQKRNLNTLRLPPLGSGNLRARLRENAPRVTSLGTRARPDHSPQSRAGRCGDRRGRARAAARRALPPRSARRRPRRPHNPLLAPGTGGAGRGGAGRAGGNNFLFGPLCPSPLAAVRASRARKPEAGSGAGTRCSGKLRGAERGRAGLERLLCVCALQKDFR